MNEFLEQFLLECRELVQQGIHDLLVLEHQPGNSDLLASAFRAFHTLKGGAGIVDFGAMARALHAAEDILTSVRSGTHRITPALINDCLACLDQVTAWLDTIEGSGALPADAEADAEAIVARLAGRVDEKPTVVSPPSSSNMPAAARAVLDAQLLVLAETDPEGLAGRIVSAARVAANVLRRLGRLDAAGDVERSLVRARDSADRTLVGAAIARSLADPEAPSHEPSAGADGPRTEAAARTIRVDAERIDALVNLTGELTIAKNGIGHLAKIAKDEGNSLAPLLGGQHAQMERLIAALQHSVLTMRVLPLRQVFQRFPRLVREMASAVEKPCRLVAEGEETEVDKAIVEALYEPLLHVLRNAVDHGVETETQRAADGKPAVATISLRGRREGEHVVVEVEDDGGGIELAKIRRIAAARGLGSAESLAGLTDAEATELVFAPGFSTATTITDLSGRGVGMDAVRNAVERLGGRVSIQSRPRAGTVVRFTLPFSVMMTQVMTVEAGGQIFGLPLDAVVETIQIDRDQICPVGSARAFVRRNRTVPVIDLRETLRQEQGGSRSTRATLAIVSVGGQFGALEVDRVGERLEVILKPMVGLLSGMPGISGTTLSGNGDILLVLDVLALLS